MQEPKQPAERVFGGLLRNGSSYTAAHVFAGRKMIKRFRSKALKLAFEGNLSKIQPNFQNKVAQVLDALDAATSLEDLKGLTGFHELKGDCEGEYAVTITANWRITFSPLIESVLNETTGEEEDAFHVSRVHFEDYH